jgi:branched-subunit amino acid aminotransferase/4-amino-4-deoxychorismate lyase
MGWVWLDGRLLREDEGLLALERAIFYGDGLFETLRVCGGQPLFLGEHIRRLVEGAAVLGFAAALEPEALACAVQETVAANEATEGSVRLTVIRGRGPGLYPEASAPPLVLVTFRPGVPYAPELYVRGFKAIFVSFPRNERSPLVYIKSLNFLENILGKKEAAAKGADEGLFLNTAGYLCEGTVSNIFLVREQTLVTPDVASGLLPGVTRKVVIRLAREAGLTAAERPVRPEELFKADEAFLTNSLLEVMPLVAVEDRMIGVGKPGPVTRFLRERYARYREEGGAKLLG